jgi:hypothetical protein
MQVVLQEAREGYAEEIVQVSGWHLHSPMLSINVTLASSHTLSQGIA